MGVLGIWRRITNRKCDEMKSQYLILALQKITILAFVYKWTCREEMRGWDHYWISGPSSAIIGAAYMGYMDITFPHGCVWINRLEWKFLR